MAMLGAVGIGRTAPGGVRGELWVGIVDRVDEPRGARREPALAFCRAGCASSALGTGFARFAARRSDPSLMIENGNPSLLWACATGPENPGKINANAKMLKRFHISLIQSLRMQDQNLHQDLI
ncbi:hypothetical protein [Pseudorhodoplanes sp.]|uniref:hypothetical protein n=1 Tax=Pseudorhodoplanes sp. TaxID=1934341 RepID=UPI003918A7B2